MTELYDEMPLIWWLLLPNGTMTLLKCLKNGA